jgi:hypothetical protein
MPDVDEALDQLRRLAEHPPRVAGPVEQVAERARRLRRRRRTRLGVGTLVLVLMASLGGVVWANARSDEPPAVVAGPAPGRTVPPAGPRTEPDPGDESPPDASGPRTSPRAEVQRQAIRDGVMPDLRGGDLNTLGDGTGVLFDLQDVIGQQRTVNIANDAPEGTVVEQDPLPGTPLDDVTAWTLTVSAGGPVVRYVDLPDDVAAFAATLAGFDPTEPLVARPTEFGLAYKTDRWLFALRCAAVDRAYRTFADARYDTACPGRIEGA